MKRNRPKFKQPVATVDMEAEPDWHDITERVRAAKDRELIPLTSDAKITGDVSAALKHGVRIRLNEYKLWAIPTMKPLLRMSWEVLI
jgi:hypothetical protein